MFTIPNRLQFGFLKLWHAAFSGAFIVAYVSDDAPAMHAAVGYFILVLLALRVLAALAATHKSPLALPNPKAAFSEWLDKTRAGRKARNPLYAGLAALLLGGIFLAAASGWLADIAPKLEDLHEGIAEMTPLFVFAHVGFIFYKPLMKRLRSLIAQGNLSLPTVH